MMVSRQAIGLGLAIWLAAPAMALAQEAIRFGDDAYAGGENVVIAQDGLVDVFAAGNRIRIESDVAGTAHLMGRRVALEGSAGAVYAIGMEVRIEGAVAGDATVTGYEIRVGAVGGDLRASGGTVTLTGPVGRYALLAGDEVRVEGTVAGDLIVAARQLDFGPLAQVGGTLILYGDGAATQEVPASVAPAERIERRPMESGASDRPSWERATIGSLVGQFLIGVLVISVIAAAIAAIMPGRLAGLRHILLDRPLRSLWFGALTLSALTGAVVVAGLTLVGLLAAPAFLLTAVVMGFLGYVIGVYAFGVSLLNRVGRTQPDSFGDRALAAAVGALAAGVIALIPFLGWLFVLALALAGVGAIIIAWANPRFFATEE